MKEFLAPQLQRRVVQLQEWYAQTVAAIQERRRQSVVTGKMMSNEVLARRMDHMDSDNTDLALAIDARPPRIDPTDPLTGDQLDTLLALKRRLKADIDALVASECVYCGELLLRTIDMPFILDTEFERLQEEWRV